MLVMLPMSTASKVYLAPTGTIGRVSVIEPLVGRTLFAIVNELWKTLLRSSRGKVLSVGSAVQVMATVPLEIVAWWK